MGRSSGRRIEGVMSTLSRCVAHTGNVRYTIVSPPGPLPRLQSCERETLQKFDLGSKGTASRPGVRGHIKAADEQCLRIQTKEIKQKGKSALFVQHDTELTKSFVNQGTAFM